MNFQEKVKEFMIAGGQFVATEYREMTEEERVFRHKLLQEEINELKQAIEDDNRVEILDALCDIKVVNDGTANTIGDSHNDELLESIYYYIDEESIDSVVKELSNIDIELTNVVNLIIYQLAQKFNFSLETFKEALNRVHESNMSKFCDDEIEANETVIAYEIKDEPVESYYKKNGDKWVVLRKEDNKILKSVLYHAVDLTDLV